MGTQVVRRGPREPAPAAPGGELVLEAPPEEPRIAPTGLLPRVLPVVMVLASVGFVVVLGVSNPTSWLFGGMIALSTLGMLAGGVARGGATRRAEADAERADYLRYLAQVRRRVRAAAADQRASLEWTHPDPDALAGLARGRRTWERRPTDPDFAHVRVGRGAQRLATALVPPQTGPVTDLEPVTTAALRRFVRAHSVVESLPTAVSLRAFAAVAVGGPDASPVGRERRRALVRAVIAQLVTLHSPDDLLLAVVVGDADRQAWEWVKWLPHVAHPRLRDGAGPVRMIASSLSTVWAWLAPELADRPRFSRGSAPPAGAPHIVVICEGGTITDPDAALGDDPADDGVAGVTLVDLGNRLDDLVARRGLRLVVAPDPTCDPAPDPTRDPAPDRIGAATDDGVEWFGRPDLLREPEAEALARRLAPCRTPASAPGSGPSTPGLLDLLGVPGAPETFDVAAAWRPRAPRDRLRVPFGLGEDGEPVELDLKEAAQEGMGPHGLCVGATGSGKSELLRTLVLGLITTHSSAALNLVLVDFKGGATFAGLADAPHVAAVITNLADDLALVDRMQDALAGEMTRRQELLRAAGNLASVADYERARDRGADLTPLPALFVVVDEFSELLHQKPDLADLFTAIGRLGRSLQIHLLLASQRVDEGRLRGLESHLSYRIGLRTFSAADSRAVLGVPDAATLPAVPGLGYLRSDTSTMVRFTAGYVSGPARHPDRARRNATVPHGAPSPSPRPFHGGWVDPVGDGGAPGPDEPAARDAPDPPVTAVPTVPTVLDVVVDRLRDAGPPAHEVWLPPLEGPVDLVALLPGLEDTPDRGRTAPGFPANGTLRLPLGLVDRPYEQRRELLWADLSGAAGHVGVAGGPRAGTSTLLATLVCAAALTHTPDELAFHVIDLGGGTLGGLAALPHVGTVAGRGDTDLVRRVVAEVAAVATARERWFRERGVGSVADLRARRRRGEDLPDPFGDLVLVIDGWHAFRADHEALEAGVITLATTGLSYGVHVAIGVGRWAELRPALKDLLGTRIELRLGDPGESEVDRRVAAAVPTGRPGHGIAPDRSHVLVALPTPGIVDAVAAAWPGDGVPPVALLPERVDVTALPGPGSGPAHLLPIGVDEDRLAPVLLDVAADPHLLVYADGESGKTSFLRLLAHQVVTHYTPEQARLMIVDYRRGLLGAVDSEHLISYTSTADALTEAMTDLVASLRRRLPGPDVTPEQLRSRSWWTGPEVFLLVDDYDLVASAAGNPLGALVDLLAQAKDVGLHVIVARRVGGTSRAMFEPVLARLRELATPGLVGHGSRDEGPLVGAARPGPRPPGRAVLVTRRHGEQLVQLAWRDPDEPIRPGAAGGTS